MKILFVGNSYLYRGNAGSRELSPYGMFDDMARAGGHQVELDDSFIGGSALETHWLDTQGDQAREKLANGNFDIAVFQGTFGEIPDNSTGHSAINFPRYADLFANLAADNGTQSVFFSSWAPDYLISISGGDQIKDEVHADNLAAANRNDAYYSPNGLAYYDAYLELTARYGNGDNGQTAENLLTDGAVHSTDLGAYLATAVLYSTIFNEAPPTSWKPASVSGSDAALMRQIAWDTVRSDGVPITDGAAPPPPPPPPPPAPSGGNGIIDGRYFDDTNGDGRANNEPGVAGQTVSLLDSSGRVVDTAISANSGWYRFSDLAAGTYRVLFEDSPGRDFVINRPGTGGDQNSDIISVRGSGDGLTGAITIGNNERRDRVDAGLEDSAGTPAPAPTPTPPPPSGGNGIIEGRYFIDADGNGIATGDAGVARATVSLLNSNGQVIETASTGTNGFYRFDELAAGTYRVLFEDTPGQAFIINGPGTGGNQESDIVSLRGNGDGLTGQINLGANERRKSVDAGLGDSDAPSQPAPAPTPEPDGDRLDASDATIRGTSGGNTLTGTGGADVIFGFGGNDRIDARSGNDFINGGGGIDRLNGQDGNDTFVFDAADAAVNGGNGVDRFVFNSGRVDLTDISLNSVEFFDLAENGQANIATIGQSQLRQARDATLRIIADQEDIVRLETSFDVVRTGSTTRDGERFDVYRLGESSWATDFLISQDSTLEIL